MIRVRVNASEGMVVRTCVHAGACVYMCVHLYAHVCVGMWVWVWVWVYGCGCMGVGVCTPSTAAFRVLSMSGGDFPGVGLVRPARVLLSEELCLIARHDRVETAVVSCASFPFF